MPPPAPQDAKAWCPAAARADRPRAELTVR